MLRIKVRAKARVRVRVRMNAYPNGLVPKIRRLPPSCRGRLRARFRHRG